VSGATLLPRVRARIRAEALVAAGSLALAVVALGAATVRDLRLSCPLMLVGGVAWISVLSTLNVAAQQASPPWVKARSLAVYLMVFQAGIAGGSAFWGAVASSHGLSAAYFGIAFGLLLGAVLAARLGLAEDEGADHTPSHHWPEPVVAGDPALEAGPIMVQVEYSVEPTCAAAFRAAMGVVGRNRRRDGAVQWWLFEDTSDPSRFVETWIEETWAEHLRNHERVSVAHRDVEDKARALTRSPETAVIRHFIASDLRPPAGAAVRSVEARTLGCASMEGLTRREGAGAGVKE
jgi:quinol monooxygenase YgiN